MSGPGDGARSPLWVEVEALVTEAARVYRGSGYEPVLDDLVARLHEPLRVAIAGQVKAGKSTLLNALVGDELAPTDAGECTKLVTWYRHGPTYRVTMQPREGPPRQVPFTRNEGAVEVSLGGIAADDIQSLHVEWPVPGLSRLTLIDTPGIGSLSAAVSARSLAFLTPDDESPTPSDAVVYLLRHLHATDVAFLSAFHEEEYARPSPINCIGVLARADEVSTGRLDAMGSARRIAARYSADPRLRRLVQRVVPVAGLLAQTGADLREDEFRQLRAIANIDAGERDALLLSADRFAHRPSDAGPEPATRRALLDRFGLFGVRLAVDLLGRNLAPTASQLAATLVGHSGIDDLRDVLMSQFADRRDTLKARSVLLGLNRLVVSAPVSGGDELAGRLERIGAGAHELTELRMLDALRLGEVDVRANEAADLERLFGGEGAAIDRRLGLEPDASPDVVTKELLASLSRWRQRAENPASSAATTTAARAAVRTCEGLYVTALAPRS